jgi:signal transduction histidine kinase
MAFVKKEHIYHLLFGISLAALVALGTWWAIFFKHSVELERNDKLNELRFAVEKAALVLGQADNPPQVGPLSGAIPLEVIPASQSQSDDQIAAPLIPKYPELIVRPALNEIQRINTKLERRRVMVIGEGSLLFVLLGVCTFMLYRLVRQEHRHMTDMEVFVATVNHEMKTPLTGIKSLLQTFVAGNVPQTEEAKLYAMGLKETERLEHMVENILISGRIRGGRYRIQHQIIELKPFLDHFIEHRRRYLADQPDTLRLMWEAQQTNLKVSVDPYALQVILENLTDNAYKYGGPTPQVFLIVQNIDNKLCISITDTGIGFDPAKAEKLFIPFVRVTNLQPGIQHGTGLGLAIARALARQMDGDILAESEGLGKGSRFSLILPTLDG